jgi:hypothetical protein
MVGVAARRSIEQIEKTPAIRPLNNLADFIQRKNIAAKRKRDKRPWCGGREILRKAAVAMILSSLIQLGPHGFYGFVTRSRIHLFHNAVQMIFYRKFGKI